MRRNTKNHKKNNDTIKKKNVLPSIIIGILAITTIFVYVNWNTTNVLASDRLIGLPDSQSFILTVEKEAFKMVSEYFGHLITILGVSYAIKAIWGGD
ncbi:MAG: hypothetical protein O4861_07935 [Trichodesmium sp. St16_bin4-tuft]|jgi:hypothetical protein|nr:hypothetical protein [Trichodesmium sp. St16_bin4-tuft]